VEPLCHAAVIAARRETVSYARLDRARLRDGSDQAAFLRLIDRVLRARFGVLLVAPAGIPAIARILRIIAELMPELTAMVRALRLRPGFFPELRHRANNPPIMAPIPTVMTPQKAGSLFAALRMDLYPSVAQLSIRLETSRADLAALFAALTSWSLACSPASSTAGSVLRQFNILRSP
jgi:hypothetical protein